eukprot:2674030-Prymnesium_polylepis.1
MELLVCLCVPRSAPCGCRSGWRVEGFFLGRTRSLRAWRTVNTFPVTYTYSQCLNLRTRVRLVEKKGQTSLEPFVYVGLVDIEPGSQEIQYP